MRGLVLLAVLALTIPGCLGEGAVDDAAAPASASPPVDVTDARPDPTFGDVVVGEAAAPDTNATLLEAPELQVGEWWKIEFESPLDGRKSTFYRVMAGRQGDTYLFGMPHEGWWKEAVVYHTPAFGDVNAADLSYNTHDILFQPLKFPLQEGQTWETAFSGGNTMTANVKVEDEFTARVTFTTDACGPLGLYAVAGQCAEGANTVLELVYDARIHEVVEFWHPTATFRVVEHGYGFEGWVTVPRGERLVFFHGRIGPGLDIQMQPAAPTETVEVNGGFNRVTFIQALGNFAPGAGAYRETATAPDGTSFVTESLPAVGGGLKIEFYEFADPDGAWDLEHVVAGPGIAFIEGIAYHQYDIHLPDGAIRSDHSHEVIR